MNRVPPAQGRCLFAIETGDMTPPVGIYHRMWGAAKHDQATGVHRPLRLTAMVVASIEQSKDFHVLLALDHCIIGQEELDRIRKRICETTGIPAEQIAVVCSHTHAAGLLSLDRVDLPGGDLIPGYLDSIARTAGDLVQSALENMQPATIVFGTGQCNLAANRDFWDEAAGQFVCGFNPEEPADDTLVVARVESDHGETLATIVNYACHPTTLAWDNTLISPDFPGAMRDVVENATGGVPCLFLQGASGELGPREGFVGDVDIADKNGRQLGHAAVAVLESLPAAGKLYEYAGPVVSGATIGTWQYREMNDVERKRISIFETWQGPIDLPYRELSPLEKIAADLKELEAKESVARDAADDEQASELRALAERKRRELARRRALPEGKVFPYRTVIWRIGAAVFVIVQGEPYSLLQTELRRQFPDSPLIVASIGFSWGVAYLPPEDKYGKGLYQENIAIVAPGALEMLIEEIAVRMEELLN